MRDGCDESEMNEWHEGLIRQINRRNRIWIRPETNACDAKRVTTERGRDELRTREAERGET